jgi:hypothetical protein
LKSFEEMSKMKFTRMMGVNVLACASFVMVTQGWLVTQDERQHHPNQTHYTVQNLGSLGGTFCCLVISNNNSGLQSGVAVVHFSKDSRNLGDRKCLPESRKSFVGHS